MFQAKHFPERNDCVWGPDEVKYTCENKKCCYDNCFTSMISRYSTEWHSLQLDKKAVYSLFQQESPPAWTQEAYRPPAHPLQTWDGISPTPVQTWDGVPPSPVELWTDTQSENITFLHPSDAGGKKVELIWNVTCRIKTGKKVPVMLNAVKASVLSRLAVFRAIVPWTTFLAFHFDCTVKKVRFMTKIKGFARWSTTLWSWRLSS